MMTTITSDSLWLERSAQSEIMTLCPAHYLHNNKIPILNELSLKTIFLSLANKEEEEN